MGIKIKEQYMNRSLFRTIKNMNGSIFFKGQVYEWGRFRNTASTPVPHLSPSYLPLPPPPPQPPQTREIYRSLIKHLRTVNEKYFRVGNCLHLG